MKAVIPAAGLGTRFLPATKCIPKELLPVYNKPVIQYVVEEALAPSEVDECVIVNSHAKPQIEQYFSENASLVEHLKSHGKAALAQKVEEAQDLPVSFGYQDDPRGLGHAVLCAREAVGNNSFFVLLGDYFILQKDVCVKMAEISAAHNGASVIAVAPCAHEDVKRYGIVAGDVVENERGLRLDENEPGAVLKLTGLVEKPQPQDAPTDLFIVGRYLLTPRVMELLEDQEPGAGGEIQLTDALVRLLAEEEMYALVIDQRAGYDTGTPEAWAATNARVICADSALRRAFVEELGTTTL